MPDFSIQDHGSILILQAHNDDAFEHVRERVSDETQFWGRRGIVVEPRYIADLVERLQEEGFEVEL